MALSALPLSYCTNVHPAQSLKDVERILGRFTAPIRQRFNRPVAAGLWLARPVCDELSISSDRVTKFAHCLADHGLNCHTLNAFPYGNFHGLRVKEQVYLPDWAHPDRLTYTNRCAGILAALLPRDTDGSISTVPLGFKPLSSSPAFHTDCARNVAECAVALARLRNDTGKLIRLAIEPEPFCELETTTEAVEFFRLLWGVADTLGCADAVREHVGVCFDICHQVVEFEDVAASVRALDAAGVRINKVHISCAIRLEQPAANPDGVAALRRYVEPRYMHQTFGRLADGRLVRAADLTEKLLSNPGPDFAAADEWRVHFHVPVDAENLGPLGTTRPALREALTAVAALDYAPHLEVETYTWSVLPGEQPVDIVHGLTRELEATSAFLDDIAARPGTRS